MGLEKLFGAVCRSKLIQILSEAVADGRVVSLMRKYLNADVIASDKLKETRADMPQRAAPVSVLRPA